MKNFIKSYIKKIINFYGWNLTKNYKNKSYTNQKPNLELLNALHSSSGVFHIGAHRGSEAEIYNWLHKKTIWIEANPKIFIDLNNHISKYINQQAFNLLLYELDDKEITFNVSSNDGASSSIFDFGAESKKENLKMVSSYKLKSKKIDTFFEENELSASDYDFWVMDIQGAELSALKGADKSLKKCKYVYVEISDGDFYKGAVQWNELHEYLKNLNFVNLWKPQSKHTDVLFKKKNFNL